MIADKFCEIPNKFDALQKDDIVIPEYDEKSLPQFSPADVWIKLTELKPNKSTVPGDLPAKLVKLFAPYIAEPLCHIINESIKRGEYPQIYKNETCTPVPKKHPPEST